MLSIALPPACSGAEKHGQKSEHRWRRNHHGKVPASYLAFDDAPRFDPHFERTSMNNSPLHRIQNWPQIAHDAGYSVSALAGACGVSVRMLERFFLAAFGCRPSQWLKRLRMERAIELLRDGSNVKEAAARLGYEDPSHFSREFKSHYGLPPNNYANPAAKARQHSKCRIRPRNCRVWP